MREQIAVESILSRGGWTCAGRQPGFGPDHAAAHPCADHASAACHHTCACRTGHGSPLRRDASTGQLVEYASRPVLRMRATSTWDDGFAEIRKAMLLLGEEARRLGSFSRHAAHGAFRDE